MDLHPSSALKHSRQTTIAIVQTEPPHSITTESESLICTMHYSQSTNAVCEPGQFLPKSK